MFYPFIKLLARFSLLFFFRRKIVCGSSLRHLKGPAVIAANHPDSMLDAALIACLCRRPVHFTIRSDMFNNPLFRFLLKFLNGIPIYRVTEEKNKVKKNFNSIERCRNLLQRGEIIIIFSEGITEHNWKLKPIKSATARIVQYALLDNLLTDRLQVVPVGLTYSNYNQLAKTVVINVGAAFFPGKLPHPEYTGLWKQAFNVKLYEELHQLIPELHSDDRAIRHLWQGIITNTRFDNNCTEWIQHLSHQATLLSTPDYSFNTLIETGGNFWAPDRVIFFKTLFSGVLLTIPGIAGLVLNALFYFPTKIFATAKTRDTIFYDSLFIGLATVLYPIYILVVAGWLATYTALPLLCWIVLIPFGGWCAIQLWIRAIKILNYLSLTPEDKKYLKTLVSLKTDQ